MNGKSAIFAKFNDHRNKGEMKKPREKIRN